jgi:hypothetical protein
MGTPFFLNRLVDDAFYPNVATKFFDFLMQRQW